MLTVNIEKLEKNVTARDITRVFNLNQIGVVTNIRIYQYDTYNTARVEILPVLESIPAIRFEETLIHNCVYSYIYKGLYLWKMSLVPDDYSTAIKDLIRPDGFIYYNGELVTQEEFLVEISTMITA